MSSDVEISFSKLFQLGTIVRVTYPYDSPSRKGKLAEIVYLGPFNTGDHTIRYLDDGIEDCFNVVWLKPLSLLEQLATSSE